MVIVTDSTADLPRDIVEKYNIEVVPLYVRLGDKMFRDYYDVSPTEFIRCSGKRMNFQEHLNHL